jgi:concanavalin A-like lectin/glucanase superfamily protein
MQCGCPNHGNNATCAGECPALAPGIHGNACSFDGTAELDIASFTIVQAVAIAAWVRVDTDSASIDCAINRGFGPDHGNSWQLCVQMGGAVYFGTDGGMTKRTFIDGALVIAHPAASTSYDGSPIRLGRDYDSGLPAFPFRGLLDDIYLFNRTLSADEVAALAAP